MLSKHKLKNLFAKTKLDPVIARLRSWWQRQTKSHRILLLAIALLLVIRLILVAANAYAVSRSDNIATLLQQTEEISRQLALAPTPASMELDRLDGSIDAHNAQLQTIANNINNMELSNGQSGSYSPHLLFLIYDKPKAEVSPQKAFDASEKVLELAKEKITRHQKIMLTLEPFFEYDPSQDLEMISTDNTEAVARMRQAKEGLESISQNLAKHTDPQDNELKEITSAIDALAAKIGAIDSPKALEAYAKEYDKQQKIIRDNRTEHWQKSKAEIGKQLSSAIDQLLKLESVWIYAVQQIP